MSESKERERVSAFVGETRSGVDVAGLFTARRRAEADLAYFRDLFDLCPEPYLVTDLRGAIRAANRAAALVLQVTPQFLAGRPLLHFVARADCGAFRAALASLQETTGSDAALEIHLRPRHKGAPFLADIRVRRVRTGCSIVLLWIATARGAEAQARPAGPPPGEDPRRTARIVELEEAVRGQEVTIRRQAALIDELVDFGQFAIDERAPVTPSDELNEADLTGVRVLVAEADARTRDLLIQLLTDCGAEVATASTGAQALALVERWRPDVLVSDVDLPDDDGFALIRRVRELEPDAGGAVPAIALTGHAELDAGRQALVAGYQVHVAKPIDGSWLTHAVANVAGAPIFDWTK
jgi:CheY-like chemotaxis protein/PAS domain-containing protein